MARSRRQRAAGGVHPGHSAVGVGRRHSVDGNGCGRRQPARRGLEDLWHLLDGPADVQFENATQLCTRALCPEPGAYTFELSAEDSQFSSRAVATVFVDLLPGIQFPAVEIPAIALVNSTVSLSANAWDLDGAIERVEFYCNGLPIGSAVDCDPDSGYAIDWTPATNGCFKLNAIAFDDLGGSAASEDVLVEATFPPQIAADLPNHDLCLAYNDSAVTFSARAWDPDGSVTNFAVFVGPALIDQVAGDRIEFTGPADVGGMYYEKVRHAPAGAFCGNGQSRCVHGNQHREPHVAAPRCDRGLGFAGFESDVPGRPVVEPGGRSFCNAAGPDLAGRLLPLE